MGRSSDDLYLICFTEQTGRAVGTDAVAGLGLAGGLLTELVLGAHLIVHDGLAYPAPGVGAPADVTLWEVLHAVAGQRQPRDVGTWLRFLADEAVTDVRNRMCAAGLLAPVRGPPPRGVGERGTCPPTPTPRSGRRSAWPTSWVLLASS